MTWTELIAFWVTFAITFVAFISWFNLDKRLEKPLSRSSAVHHGRRYRKEITLVDLEERVDELTPNYVESPAPKIKAEIDELSFRLGKMRSPKPPQKS
jgi:hypothetical protein